MLPARVMCLFQQLQLSSRSSSRGDDVPCLTALGYHQPRHQAAYCQPQLWASQRLTGRSPLARSQQQQQQQLNHTAVMRMLSTQVAAAVRTKVKMVMAAAAAAGRRQIQRAWRC
jgi:hypothetical protein